MSAKAVATHQTEETLSWERYKQLFVAALQRLYSIIDDVVHRGEP